MRNVHYIPYDENYELHACKFTLEIFMHLIKLHCLKLQLLKLWTYSKATSPTTLQVENCDYSLPRLFLRLWANTEPFPELDVMRHVLHSSESLPLAVKYSLRGSSS